MNKKSALPRSALAGVLFALLALCSSTAAAALLQVTGGVLTGARNVNVGGTYYDVAFQDGSCNSLYNGCVDSALVLTNLEQALLAGQALLDQVYIDGPDGNFNSPASMVAGCDSGAWCFTLVPYQDNQPNIARLAFVYHYAPEYGVSSVIPAAFQAAIDLTPVGTMNYATFTLSAVQAPAQVPEPGTLALLGLGVAGLVVGRRRKV